MTMPSLQSIPLISILAAVAIGCTDSAPERSTEASAAAQRSADQVPSDGGTEGGRVNRIFVSNYLTDTISVVEGTPGMEVKAIPGGESPHGLAVKTSEPALLAVANSTGDGVTFIDPDTLEQKQFVKTSRGPQDLVFSDDEKLLFVVSPLTFELHTIDVASMKTVGEPVKFEKKPRRILTDGSGARLYVLLVGLGEKGAGAEVAVLDARTREIEKRVPTGRQPDAMALGNGGRTLATTSFDDSTITVIDTESLEVVATHAARTGMGLAVHPEKPIAYSCESMDDVIQVLDLETGKEIKTITAGAWPSYPDFGSSGRFLYVPHEESDSLVKLDTETNEVVAKIAVGREPIEVAVYEVANPS